MLFESLRFNVILSEDFLWSRLNLKSFYTQILRRTRFLIAPLFSLPSQKLFLKLVKAIYVIFERFFNSFSLLFLFSLRLEGVKTLKYR